MSLPIVDLHCDLLSYLSNGTNRTAYDPESRCSIPYLKEGGVIIQTLAIYTKTEKKATKNAELQFQIFKRLPTEFPNEIIHFSDPNKKYSCPQIILSIENASGILEANESFEKAIQRLNRFQSEAGPILYISLTWHDENRFGGGNMTPDVPLKEDGKRLLEYMAEHGISIDLSHTSDATAEGILNFIDKKSFPIIPIASHSNFRKICSAERNLPEEFAKEIIKKKGLIGLNFVKAFVGESPDDFIRHLEYMDSIGGWKHSSLGADFFTDVGTPKELEHLLPFFFEEFGNSRCYPRLLELLKDHISHEKLHDLCFRNFFAYMERRGNLL